MFFSLPVAASVAMLLNSQAYAAKIDKPPLFPGLPVGDSFAANLAITPMKIEQWSWGWIPQRCLDRTEDGNFSSYDMEIYNVQFDDCSSPWTMCRHKDAQHTIESLATFFGQLPVHERQWVTHVMAFPQDSPSAYMTDGDIVMQGNTSLAVFQHETTHVLDFFRNQNSDNLTEASSGTAAWLDAINNDTCVSDNYGETNAVEAYAQIGVLSLYEIVTPWAVGLSALTPNITEGSGLSWTCLQHQISALNAFQLEDMYPGGICNRRSADSAVVSMTPTGTAASKRMVVGLKPEANVVIGMEGVSDVAFVGSSKHAHEDRDVACARGEASPEWYC